MSRVIATGIGGSAAGITSAELLSETVARALVLTGWPKCGLKGVLKGLLGCVFYFLSARLPGLWSLFAEMMCYSSIGSWCLDIYLTLFPGGIIGLSERIAMGIRKATVGVEVIASEMAEHGGPEEEKESEEVKGWI